MRSKSYLVLLTLTQCLSCFCSIPLLNMLLKLTETETISIKITYESAANKYLTNNDNV